ncbi:hypothetical protein N788_12145 [Arenimonas donghaensis DSM 18148 = HO3-R19]|uniref:Aerotolerance regulator N-terminal domain-containing protein n=2 Tax=Arenimonas TaxID=490567 RepID=A0A087MJD9_9GAMM|nr:hypothetical protein N788_12145 [Arenimonas donghaensis DSM 18148 = HO3-R19]
MPLGLLALLGLVVPLLVHLARREQQQPTMFAALRWLHARQRPRQRLRIEHWLLLALRLALVAGLALLLAAPWFTDDQAGPPRVLVHPSLPVPEAPEGAELRWLAPGFPHIDSAVPEAPVPVSSLLREADAGLPPGKALVVHVPAILDGVDGERPRLSRPVQWLVAEASTPDPAPDRQDEPPPAMAVRHGPDHAHQAKWLAAAQRAWLATTDPAPPPGETLMAAGASWPDDTRVLAWLADGAVPANVLDFARDGGTLLIADTTHWPVDAAGQVAWRGEEGSVRLRAAGFQAGRILQFAQPLEPAAFPELLDPRFPRWLLQQLQPPPAAPARVDARRHVPRDDGPAFTPPSPPLAPWLVLVLAALFVVERWLAAGLPTRRPA